MTTFALRPWQRTDAESVAAAADNPNIAANLRNAFPSPYTLADAEWFVGDCIAQGEARQLMRAIVIDGRAAGSISVSIKDDVYEKSAELGYWLAEDYWGRGVMTEAVRQICREAFDRFDILRIFAEPFAENLGSRRVLEKAGFLCEGTMRRGVYKNGRVQSYCIYALLREELK
ncbi:GNAT family N-acetyltransferase [Oscillibacter sp.]|uniref:GNAT family N-acetyltransferase n=1 Tax=Oscillibacter sp. TaxID=1945593 RepID=UPI002D80A0AB|nr:GNAT family protein [Oscillibacter sp.]